jgi:RHS repeat-associated protein
VETALHDSGRQKEDPQPVCRYQIDNHLGSCSLELDQNGRVISYEEYYPYGSTSYQAVKPEIDISLKRYRFSGKEMNAESGLYYYGARYYAAWLGRWIKPDPAKLVDGLNLYSYVSNNPVKFVDPNGNQELLAQGVPDVSPEDYDQWHYESIRQSLWDIGLFKVIAASGTAGEDYLIRAIMKYENALFCLESDLCEDKWEAFQQLKESSNQRLFASLAIACERPLLAAEAVLSIPDQIMRMMGMSEQDIQAVNFALMMTGIGEARSLASSSRKLMSRRSVSKVYPTRKSPKTGKLQELRPSKGGEGPRRWHNVRQEKVSTTAGEYGRYIQQGLKIEEAQYLLNPYTGMGHHFFARRLRLPAFFSESRFNVLKPNITIGQFYELHYKIDLSFHGAAFPRSIGGSWSGSGLGIQRYGLMLRLWHGSPRPLKLTVGGTFVGGSAGALYYALSDDED